MPDENHGAGARTLACCAVLTGACAAQSSWHLDGGDIEARITGASEAMLRGPRAEPVSLPAGDYRVNFGVDALGKPRSLELSAADGSVVRLAVAHAAAVPATELDESTQWREVTGGGSSAWRARVTGSEEAADYRFVARVAAGGEGSFGVVVRWLDAERHYRFVWDRTVGELRLERQMGGDVLVLARQPATSASEGEHTLALQAHGFRLQATLDDEPILAAFDGAFIAGACGTWAAAADVAWGRLAIEPAAEPRTSTALATCGRRAVFHAHTNIPSGHRCVLEFEAGCTWPEPPRDEAGFEPWLLSEGVGSPRFALARASVGTSAAGVFAVGFTWPGGGLLAGEAALVRGLLVSRDGDVIAERTPGVGFTF
jgi:hypothetical protein